MGNAMIYAGIAIRVAALAGIMVYAHDNQENYSESVNNTS